MQRTWHNMQMEEKCDNLLRYPVDSPQWKKRLNNSIIWYGVKKLEL